MNSRQSDNEAARLEALRSYAVLDTPREREFDELVNLAARVCQAPIALLTFIDSRRQWCKASVGATSAETPREESFCAVALAAPEPSDLLVVPDAMADPRFASNPLVAGEPHIRFYAGAPLVAPSGHALGTLCVMDRVAREVSPPQAEALRTLSRQAVLLLELRRLRREERATSHALRESEELKTRLIESSQDCIKVLDLEGRLLAMNVGGMRTLEICDFGAVCGSDWAQFWEGLDREACQAALKAAREGGVGRFVGFFPTVQTRKPMWFDVVVSPILGKDGRPEKLLAVSRDITESKRSGDLLAAIVKGTSGVTGVAFFRSFVRQLAEALQVRWVFVAECLPNLRARSLAFWRDHDFGQDFEYALAGTPCLEVTQGRVCHIPERLPELFPEDRGMIDMGTVSYLGVPLRNTAQQTIGHLVVFHDQPMPADPLVLSVMETFAARAGAELERQQADEEMRRLRDELAARKVAELEQQQRRMSDQLQQAGRALDASEERFRDLFDEAPIAYVHEDLESRFIRANRAALRILGLKPEEAVGTVGRSLVPDTPEAQRRVREAFQSIGRGTDTSGVVLELRRKDNGKPVWIQWWSRPDPSGTYTRTMFIDITDRVLMEQEKARLEAQNSYLQEEIRSEHNFEEIVGHSPALLGVLRQVDQVAAAGSTVLILGETGTGKELIARAIHDRSARKGRPLVKVNCGAISAGLVESELFGHVKGAFTGALTNRDGRFKLADGGTIFLDEVGELPLDTQVKLLRVLQEQEFEPVGSSETIRVDVRIIAATNRDLSIAAAEGKFRRDLYYRLNVFPIAVPPLRERLTDIPLLVSFFLQRFAKKFGKPMKHVPETTFRRLAAYPWPGNIRELQNVLERAILLSPGDTLHLAPDFAPAQEAAAPAAPVAPVAPVGPIAAAPAPAPGPAASPPASASPQSGGALEEVERRHIESVLAQTNWMIEGARGAAKILNLNPSTLRSRMQKLGIKRPGR